jgi:hypothetical protein
MAKLAAVVDSLDAVPEVLRDLYVQEGDRFILDADVEEHPSVRGMKSALEKERTRRAAIREYAESKGMDMSEVLAKLEDQARAERDAEKRLNEALKKERESAKQREAAIKAEYDTEIATSARSAAEAAAMRALSEHGASDLLLPHVLPALKAERVAPGRYEVKVVDAAGVPQDMDVNAYVASLKSVEKFAPAFRGSGATGSGAPINGRAGGAGPIRSLADLRTPADKAAFISKHGAAEYQKLVDGAFSR